MSTTFTTIMNDMKSSLKLAWGKVLSYFLANLGMVIVVFILALLIMIPIVSVAVLALYPWNEATMAALAQWATENPLVLGAIGIIIAVPVVSLFMVVSGSIYGMSYDLVTTGDTRAERAFSYLRHKFLTFAGTGAILTIIVLLPPAIAWGLTSYALGYVITATASAILTAFTFVWVFFTGGLTSMVFPAVVSGKGVQAAFKGSFTLTTKYFDRIYGLMSAFVLLLAVSFGPIILLGYASGYSLLPGVHNISLALIPLMVAGLWTIVAAFLWLLLFLPMIRIAWVRVYQELTGGAIATQAVADMPIV